MTTDRADAGWSTERAKQLPGVCPSPECGRSDRDIDVPGGGIEQSPFQQLLDETRRNAMVDPLGTCHPAVDRVAQD